MKKLTLLFLIFFSFMVGIAKAGIVIGASYNGNVSTITITDQATIDLLTAWYQAEKKDGETSQKFLLRKLREDFNEYVIKSSVGSVQEALQNAYNQAQTDFDTNVSLP